MKAKLILIALIVLFVTGLLVKVRILQAERDKLRSDNDRISNNWSSSVKESNENKLYLLKEKELSASLRKERDDLAEKLKIKPKEIERIVKVETVIRDTVIKEIVLKPSIKGWEFTDTINPCTVYKGIVILTGNEPIVKRTDFSYQNGSTSVYFRKRPHHFLFIRFGKPENFVQTESRCGQAKTEQFEFIK